MLLRSSIFSSTAVLFSLGAKSAVTPFSGAALQLIALQKQHFELILGEKSRRREQEQVRNKFSSTPAKRELKSIKKFRQEETTMNRLQKEQDKIYFGDEPEEENSDNNNNTNHHQNKNSMNKNNLQEFELMKEIENLEFQNEIQEQAEEIKADFVEKLESLRPLFYATKALESSKMYSMPLLKALKYFKLQEDPLFEQLSAALGRLDKNSKTRKMNELLLWGENNNNNASSTSNKNKKLIKGRGGKNATNKNVIDFGEDQDIYTNMGSSMQQQQHQHQQNQRFAAQKNQKIYLFKTQDQIALDQAKEISSFTGEDVYDDVDVDLRAQAYDRLRSYRLPQSVSMKANEHPSPNPDDIAEASGGDSVRQDLGVKKISFNHRGHWVLREKGIAASGDTRKMDPW